MYKTTRNGLLFLASGVMLTACSQPYATLQRTQAERFYSETKTASAEETKVKEFVLATPVEIPATAEVSVAAQAEVTKQVVNQVEAYAANHKELASNKKLEKRMVRVKQLLNEATTAKSLNTLQTTKKMTLMERMMTRKIDKQIKKHMASDQAQQSNKRAVLIGGIAAVAGLVLLLLGAGGVLGVIGIVGLVGGIVLLILGLLGVI
ncbi:hypothetical protein [Arsenicibacter rosenii]|uniref:DUF4349 domain-containing protein n=1 Tax=Arsenicibacter rosenii TaxID=1750698 RepID=A0A1S2VM00_9BACT|nr:hypothetical protein [Arsenicibacter rosenii]OIN59226.1 hypothetical protein BLX24_09550 [Arsenicibacter rosenii]